MAWDQRESAVWHRDLGSVQQHSRIVAEAVGDDDIGRAIHVETANSGRIWTVAHSEWASEGVASACSAQKQIDGVIRVIRDDQIFNAVSVKVAKFTSSGPLPTATIFCVPKAPFPLLVSKLTVLSL